MARERGTHVSSCSRWRARPQRGRASPRLEGLRQVWSFYSARRRSLVREGWGRVCLLRQTMGVAAAEILRISASTENEPNFCAKAVRWHSAVVWAYANPAVHSLQATRCRRFGGVHSRASASSLIITCSRPASWDRRVPRNHSCHRLPGRAKICARSERMLFHFTLHHSCASAASHSALLPISPQPVVADVRIPASHVPVRSRSPCCALSCSGSTTTTRTPRDRSLTSHSSSQCVSPPTPDLRLRPRAQARLFRFPRLLLSVPQTLAFGLAK